jgi:hypothetical protein
VDTDIGAELLALEDMTDREALPAGGELAEQSVAD